MEIDWLNVAAFCAICAGHVALAVGIVNRVHGRPLPERVLRLVRRFHDISIILLLPLFVWFAGLAGPRLFFGGRWNELPLPLLVYVAVCGALALAVPLVALSRRILAPRATPVSNDARTVNIARDLGFRPLARGPHRLLTHVPGNELFKLEVAERSYRLRGLPANWDGLSILHLSDVHFIGTIDLPYFVRVFQMAAELPADMIVFTGDLLDREALIDWIPETFGRLSAPLGCHFILGNHDARLKNTAEIRRRLEQHGWQGVAGKVRLIDHLDHPLALCGSEVPWMGSHPDLASAPERAFRLCLSHTPDNLPWARRNAVDLMLSGHNHGGQVQLPLFGPVYSPSVYGARYAGGAFWEDPTLLYVSRGISGKHPLRWNCLPELTRLVLRPADCGSEKAERLRALDASH